MASRHTFQCNWKLSGHFIEELKTETDWLEEIIIFSVIDCVRRVHFYAVLFIPDWWRWKFGFMVKKIWAGSQHWSLATFAQISAVQELPSGFINYKTLKSLAATTWHVSEFFHFSFIKKNFVMKKKQKKTRQAFKKICMCKYNSFRRLKILTHPLINCSSSPARSWEMRTLKSSSFNHYHYWSF
jgi:hypothetical protein